MSSDIKKMQAQLELYLNEIGADQHVIALVLQTLLLNLARARPEMLADLKQQVLWSLDNQLPVEGDQQGVRRRTELTVMRAQRLFQEIETALGAGSSTDVPPRAAN